MGERRLPLKLAVTFLKNCRWFDCGRVIDLVLFQDFRFLDFHLVVLSMFEIQIESEFSRTEDGRF
jgi:hypothetical protein